MYRVEVRGVRHFKINMGKLTRFYTLKVPAVTHDEAVRGAMLARDLAPYQTGALFQGIDVGTTNRGARYTVISKTPHHRDGRYRPYHLYMHGLGGKDTSKYIKSGDPHYMFTLYKIMQESYPKKIIDELKKTIRR